MTDSQHSTPHRICDLAIDHLTAETHEQAMRIEHLELLHATVLMWFKASLHQLAALTDTITRKNAVIRELRTARHQVPAVPWHPTGSPAGTENNLPC